MVPRFFFNSWAQIALGVTVALVAHDLLARFLGL